MINKSWLKAAGIRAIKTFAQTAVASITVGTAIQDINWIAVASVSAVAAICSLLTSIAGLPELKEGDKND
jgi:hypothetical protein